MYHRVNIFGSEYIALYVSVIAICVNVYIAWKNRKHALLKEEYFKLQQVVEKIDAKLLALNTDRIKFKIFFEKSFEADKDKQKVFIDTNNTFDRSIFQKNGEEVAALIDIYFDKIGEDWNFCIDKMSALSTLVFLLSKKIENGETVNWKEEADNYNKISEDFGEKPKEIADFLKEELKKFKKIIGK